MAIWKYRTLLTETTMPTLPITNEDIAKYIGQTPRNINLTYELNPKKQNHYLCLQFGTLLDSLGIDLFKFLDFLDSYESVESEKIKEYEKKIREYQEKEKKYLAIERVINGG